MHEKMHTYTRREFCRMGLGVAAGTPLAFSTACGSSGSNDSTPPPAPRSDAKVAIVRCATYGSEVQSSLQQAFDLLGRIRSLVNGRVVTVKVNLTSDGTFPSLFGLPPGESWVTDGRTAIALASILLAQGAQRIRFVDSVGSLQPMDQILTAAGWDVPALLSLGNIEIENTRNLGSGSQYVRLNVPGTGYLFSYFQLNHSYQETDVFISLAKLKQHLTAGVTLSLKNAFGITPNSLYGTQAGREDAVGYRGTLHGNGSANWAGIAPPGANTNQPPVDPGARIPRIVADLCAARPIHLAIMDGIKSVSGGEGPWASNIAPTSPALLIAGLNPVSTDAVAMAVMGYANPRASRGTRPFQNCDNHLLLAEQANIGSASLSQIEVRGLAIQQALYPYPG